MKKLIHLLYECYEIRLVFYAMSIILFVFNGIISISDTIIFIAWFQLGASDSSTHIQLNAFLTGVQSYFAFMTVTVFLWGFLRKRYIINDIQEIT